MIPSFTDFRRGVFVSRLTLTVIRILRVSRNLTMSLIRRALPLRMSASIRFACFAREAVCRPLY